jgi:general secretion pathway protein L
VLPDRSQAQATAAARLLVAEASATPIAELHVAIGQEDGHIERPIAVVADTQMQAWIADLADHAIDPDAIIPAALLLSAPDSGFVKADLGGEVIVRGPDLGFADEPGLTEMLTGGATPALLDRQQVETLLAQAVAKPPLDLRTGAYARRRSAIQVDWPALKKLGSLLAAVIVLTLAIGLVEIMRDSLGADALEAQAETLARQALPPSETVNDADRQVDERLLGLRGPGWGFTRSAGAVFAALRAVPTSEATALSFESNGTLRVAITTQGEGAIKDVIRQIEANGFKVDQTGAFTTNAGRVTGELMVSPR